MAGRRLRSLAGAVLVLAVVLGTESAPASAEPAHTHPGAPARRSFGAGFPGLVDHKWQFPLGGFGGIARSAPRRHVPVILVHGNNVDAADWYPVRDDLRGAGWTDQEIWALSYGGRGGNNGTALTRSNPQRDAEHQEEGSGPTWVTNNGANVADLYDFIVAVRAYTGSTRFSIVGHSLGVTLARKVLRVRPELRRDLVAFVGIAGANHGTSFCLPGTEGQVVSCDEIAAGTAWLADLNGPGGADESYAPARWLTVYDGTGVGDPAFAGPTYAQSPALRGADNRQFPGTYHNDLRLDPRIVTVYREFLETAEAAAATGAATSSPPGATASGVARAGAAVQARPSPLPATGRALDDRALVAALAGLFGLTAVRQTRRGTSAELVRDQG